MKSEQEIREFYNNLKELTNEAVTETGKPGSQAALIHDAIAWVLEEPTFVSDYEGTIIRGAKFIANLSTEKHETKTKTKPI